TKPVDQRGVGGRGVLGGVAVKNYVSETLRLRVVSAGLAVDEAEQSLASRAEEVVSTVVGGFGERWYIYGALQDRGQRVVGLGAQVQNRLTRVETLDDEQVDPGVQILAGWGRGSDMNPKHPVRGVGVGGHVKRSVSGGHDRRVVDDLAAFYPDERAVAGTRAGTRRKARGREAVRSRNERAGWAEVWLALEV